MSRGPGSGAQAISMTPQGTRPRFKGRGVAFARSPWGRKLNEGRGHGDARGRHSGGLSSAHPDDRNLLNKVHDASPTADQGDYGFLFECGEKSRKQASARAAFPRFAARLCEAQREGRRAARASGQCAMRGVVTSPASLFLACTAENC